MNPILAKVQESVVAKVPDDDKEDFYNVIKAGRRILYDPKTHQQLEIVKNPESRKDPVHTIANGIAGLGYILWMQSRKQMPPEVLLPALVMLMCDIMDFSEKAYGLTVSNELVAATTKEFMGQVFTKLGVRPEHLQEAIRQGQAQMAQPAAPDGQPQPAPPMAAAPNPGMLPVGGA